MIPSRYMITNERSPYPVKRRVRPRADEKGSEPAVTLLYPDSYLIMERPDFGRSSSPTVYRTIPPKSAKNKEASSFVILGETIKTPVQSRPESPTGRVSPFRGRGFKSPAATRSNSRATSPAPSPKKNLKKSLKTTDRPRIGKDIGLPPKSPMRTKSTPAGTEEIKTIADKNTKDSNPNIPKESEDTGDTKVGEETKDANLIKTSENTKDNKPEVEDTAEMQEPKSGVINVAESKEPKPEIENLSEMEESKPELKTSNTTVKEVSEVVEDIKPKPKPSPKPPRPTKSKLTPVTPNDKKPPLSPNLKTKTEPSKSVIKKATKPPVPPKKIGLKQTLKSDEVTNEVKNIVETKSEEPTEPSKSENVKAEEPKPEEVKETPAEEKKPEKLVPCFQPDKCQIAPPTMASPSPIITPTISTPSTTANLASSPMKNSQSIAAAPTAVTSSSLSSVSSTVVLTENLARKEIESRKEKAEAAGVVVAQGNQISSPPEKVASQMVKAASKDSIKWSKKDSLSGEITKVIKAEPDMEVLSPNNLRDSPPRMPPPNLAWDEGRIPNGDVPTKAQPEGKFRRFISIVWKFLSCIFCCRCLASPCCRRANQNWAPKSNCCEGKSCGNPFKRCTGKLKTNCCKGKCCRRESKPAKAKPKCCAKINCSCKGCMEKMKAGCIDAKYRLNSLCRGLFCLNRMCCQRFLRKFKFCHKLKCCQKDGCCSCWNPNVKREPRKLNKKGSRGSNNSRDKDNLDVVLVEHTSLMKAAIPVLPTCLAVFCLILNLFVPGLGTFISGILCLCFGKPRFSVKDTPKNRVGSFILNTIIGVAQLFTVIFCLVGWGWSIWWGVIMYKLSRRQKRLKLAEKNQKEAEGSNVNHNHVDVEQG